MNESWRPAPLDGYEVSSLGRVRALFHRRIPGPRLLKLSKDGPYFSVSLRGTKFRVHILVLLVFVGPRPPGAEGRHLDCDPRNNSVGNLAWGTSKENSEDTARLGRFASGIRHGSCTHPERVPRGELAPWAKLTAKEVLVILADHRMHRAIAADFGVSRSLVGAIKSGRAWKHLQVRT